MALQFSGASARHLRNLSLEVRISFGEHEDKGPSDVVILGKLREGRHLAVLLAVVGGAHWTQSAKKVLVGPNFVGLDQFPKAVAEPRAPIIDVRVLSICTGGSVISFGFCWRGGVDCGIILRAH